jgi:cytochrome c peroxidase
MRYLVIPVLTLALSCLAQEPAASDLKMFAPLPASFDTIPPASPALVQLGKLLYFENRISLDQKVSCNSCHRLDKFGVDNEPTSEGFKGQRGGRNSPTTLNAAGHFVQFWDGRARTIEDQAKGPVLNPVEMAMPGEAQVLDVLRSIPAYKEKFAAAFPGQANPITYDNFAKAVGAFERKLVTPTRWDEYLKGKKDALTPAEKAGLNTFVKSGCAMCHNGVQLGGSMYQKLGMVKPFPEQTDAGRFHVTKNEADRMMFKIPGLRNIVKTAPYFHTGKVKTLDEAVSLMAEYQTGRKLAPADIQSITTFLNALTGEPSKELTAPPQLPPAGPNTPKAKLGD